SDCPSVPPEKDRRAFGTYRLPSLATGMASRSVFSLRNVWPGAYPLQLELAIAPIKDFKSCGGSLAALPCGRASLTARRFYKWFAFKPVRVVVASKRLRFPEGL